MAWTAGRRLGVDSRQPQAKHTTTRSPAGAPDYVVLLRRRSDGVKVAYVFLSRRGTFEVIELGLYGEPPAWSGPYCSPRPRTGIFEGPDFQGRGERVRVRVVGDLITVGWSTYYWRPDLKRFDTILTTD